MTLTPYEPISRTASHPPLLVHLRCLVMPAAMMLLAATWFDVKDQDRNPDAAVRGWSCGYNTLWRCGGVEVGEGEQWRRTVTFDGPVVVSRNGIQHPLHVIGGCDGYDGESCRNPSPSCTTTGRTLVTPIFKASPVHCVEVQFLD
ncbi:hypothetical protein ACSQ67_025664 [Phaseolus vulgaris]